MYISRFGENFINYNNQKCFFTEPPTLLTCLSYTTTAMTAANSIDGGNMCTAPATIIMPKTEAVYNELVTAGIIG